MMSRVSLPMAACFALWASLAHAQQEGLVNISIDDNTFQVPIGVAAQVCNVNVGVIQEATANGGTFECEQGDVNNPLLENTQNSNAGGNGQGGGGGGQEGLVNISIDGNTFQVPIGVAAQVCNVNVGVIQEATADGGTFECEQGDANNPLLQNAGGNQ